MRSSVSTLVRTLVAGLTLSAVAACTDSVGPRDAAPGDPSLARGGGDDTPEGSPGAAGLPSTLGIVPTRVEGNTTGDGSANCAAIARGSVATKVDGAFSRAVGGYQFTVSGPDRSRLGFSPIGTPTTAIVAVLVKGGDAYDVYRYVGGNTTGDGGLTAPYNGGGNIPSVSHYVVCTVPYTPPLTVTKTFLGAQDEHMHPVEPHMGMYVVEQGSTIWLRYRIDYVGQGTLSDNMASACAALNAYYSNWGSGFRCTTAGFEGHGGLTSIPVRGSGSVYIVIDVANNGGCGDRPFINTATLAPAGGARPLTAEARPVMLWTPECR